VFQHFCFHAITEKWSYKDPFTEDPLKDKESGRKILYQREKLKIFTTEYLGSPRKT